MKPNILPPSGFPEFTPAEERVHQLWLRTLERVYAQYGFASLSTPVVEREENLRAKGGDDKEIYGLRRVLAEDDDETHNGMALRFDHTVPLALYIARQQQHMKFPFLRAAIGPVFRGERAQKGRYRQFTQADIDVIGSGSLSPLWDAYCIFTMYEALRALQEVTDFGGFRILINDRRVLSDVLRAHGVAEAALLRARSVVDTLEKVPRTVSLTQLQECGCTAAAAEEILMLASQPLEERSTITHPEFRAVCAALEQLGLEMGTDVQVHLGIARGLDYYTGTVWEAEALHPQIKGSIGGGGRYDDLGETFSGKHLPGVGGSIGVTRLLLQCLEEGVIIPERLLGPVRVLLIPLGEAETAKMLEAIGPLTRAGITVTPWLKNAKLPKALDYANAQGYSHAIVLGEDELAAGLYTLKDLRTGTQLTLPLEEIAALFCEEAC
ncbi:histidine--tRNA ligase [Candidatus Peribacteria bacterium]|nr:histidine--tRNA ligase [Candidatus Peribacteria bacterium]